MKKTFSVTRAFRRKSFLESFDLFGDLGYQIDFTKSGFERDAAAISHDLDMIAQDLEKARIAFYQELKNKQSPSTKENGT